MNDLRYPIGKFTFPDELDDGERRRLIDEIEEAPDRLREAVEGLDAATLDTPYRPDGWTVRQVVHHLPDSHLNAFIRCKLALTEDTPTIRPYDEAAWARLADARAPIAMSLDLLDAIHVRWVWLLRSLSATDFSRQLRHPEHDRLLRVDDVLALYAWHGRHHIAHVTSLLGRLAG